MAKEEQLACLRHQRDSYREGVPYRASEQHIHFTTDHVNPAGSARFTEGNDNKDYRVLEQPPDVQDSYTDRTHLQQPDNNEMYDEEML